MLIGLGSTNQVLRCHCLNNHNWCDPRVSPWRFTKLDQSHSLATATFDRRPLSLKLSHGSPSALRFRFCDVFFFTKDLLFFADIFLHRDIFTKFNKLLTVAVYLFILFFDVFLKCHKCVSFLTLRGICCSVCINQSWCYWTICLFNSGLEMLLVKFLLIYGSVIIIITSNDGLTGKFHPWLIDYDVWMFFFFLVCSVVGASEITDWEQEHLVMNAESPSLANMEPCWVSCLHFSLHIVSLQSGSALSVAVCIETCWAHQKELYVPENSGCVTSL